MIAPLRRRHRLVFLILAAVLPVLVASAWLHKPHLPDSGLPSELAEAAVTGTPLSTGDAGFSTHPAQLRRFESSIELTLESPLRAPDVLIYFSADSAETQGLPGDARLLGAVQSQRPNVYSLDAADSGRLLLYSLGHQALVDSAALAGEREPTPAVAAPPTADEATLSTDGGES